MVRSALIIVAAASLLLAGFTFAGGLIGLWNPLEPGDSGVPYVRGLDRPDSDGAPRPIAPAVAYSKPGPPVSVRLALLVALASLSLSVLPTLWRLPRTAGGLCLVGAEADSPSWHRACERTGRLGARRDARSQSRAATAANAAGAPELAAQLALLSLGSIEDRGAAPHGWAHPAPWGSSRIRKAGGEPACFGYPSQAASFSSGLRRDDPGPRTRGPLVYLRSSWGRRGTGARCQSRRSHRHSCCPPGERMIASLGPCTSSTAVWLLQRAERRVAQGCRQPSGRANPCQAARRGGTGARARTAPARVRGARVRLLDPGT